MPPRGGSEDVRYLAVWSSVSSTEGPRQQTNLAHVAVVLVHLLNVSVDDFQSDELIVLRGTSSNEEERGITPVDYFRICRSVLAAGREMRATPCPPLYSKKLHILVRRASTSCETSLMIFPFSFGESVVNHFASLCGPLSTCCGGEGASHRSGFLRLCPAERAGSDSCDRSVSSAGTHERSCADSLDGHLCDGLCDGGDEGMRFSTTERQEVRAVPVVSKWMVYADAQSLQTGGSGLTSGECRSSGAGGCGCGCGFASWQGRGPMASMIPL